MTATCPHGVPLDADIDNACQRRECLDRGAEAGPVEPPRRHLVITRATDVPMRRVQWLWDLRIVRSGLTLLAGREGLGKSTIAVDLAARVTRGELDGELYGRPRTVIYVNTEDARDYTIVPRLVAAGADLDRVVFVDSVTPRADGDDLTGSIVLPLDDELLATVIRQNQVALVVLDAATSVIDGRLDGDKDRQMRIGLERIARIGQDTGAAMLGIVHFGKRESADTGKLILGSIAWSQVARSVLAVARDSDSGDLILTGTKGNLGPAPESLGAKLISALVDTPDGAADVGRIEWTGVTDRDARDLLGGSEDGDRAESDEAVEWLLHFLTERGGEAIAGEVIGAAAKAGFAKHTVQRARKRANVQSRKGSMGGGWVWAVRVQDGHEGDTEDDEGNRSRAQSSSSSSRHLRDASTPDAGDSGATEDHCDTKGRRRRDLGWEGRRPVEDDSGDDPRGAA